jgi:hypothetical protein
MPCPTKEMDYFGTPLCETTGYSTLTCDCPDNEWDHVTWTTYPVQKKHSLMKSPTNTKKRTRVEVMNNTMSSKRRLLVNTTTSYGNYHNFSEVCETQWCDASTQLCSDYLSVTVCETMDASTQPYDNDCTNSNSQVCKTQIYVI